MKVMFHWEAGTCEFADTRRGSRNLRSEVKINCKGQKPCILKHPLHLLFPLELHSDVPMDNLAIRERP